MKHLLKVSDFSREEIEKIITRGIEIKKANYRSEILAGKLFGLLFQKSSTRTRVSFEVAIRHLGGESIYLDAVTTQMSRGETIKDSIRVLDRYLDGLIVRLYNHKDVVEMANYSRIPIINGLTDLEHPCQAISDLMTLKEKGFLRPGMKFAFFGDCNFNMANSLMVLMALFGFDVRLVCPEKYTPKEEYLSLARKYSSVEVFHDPLDGARDVDIIYTDTWVSMGLEAERAERIREFLPYQVNEKIVSLAAPECIVMHDLPAYRGFEITDGVLESEESIVFDQAENRLHCQKAILEYLYSVE